ncbi:MAG: hypothetical protein ACRYGR_06280 [Janthinobacterium lividum]
MSDALNFNISSATFDDLRDMVALSYQKRHAYEKAQPQFWRYANDAENIQFDWFNELLNIEDHLILVAKSQDNFLGFVIGQIIEAPAVYNPGGKTLNVDNFCVTCPSYWQSVGGALLKKLRQDAKVHDVSQLLVVCGSHDRPKQEFLKSVNLSIASEWYVSSL